MKTINRKMKFSGASPIIFSVTLLVSTPIIVINSFWNGVFEIHFVSFNAIIVLASILLALGFPLYVYTLKKIKRGFQEERLITKGVFSKCRNPLFAIVIFLILPGILLFFRSGLLLTIPLIFYIVFQLFIGKEEKLLIETFGDEYVKYKKITTRIIPIFWKRRK